MCSKDVVGIYKYMCSAFMSIEVNIETAEQGTLGQRGGWVGLSCKAGLACPLFLSLGVFFPPRGWFM